MGRLHITYTADPVLHRLHSETLHAIITWLSVQSRLYHVHGIPGTSQAPQRDLTRHYHMAFSLNATVFLYTEHPVLHRLHSETSSRHYHMAFSPIATAYHKLHSETYTPLSHGFLSNQTINHFKRIHRGYTGLY